MSEYMSKLERIARNYDIEQQLDDEFDLTTTTNGKKIYKFIQLHPGSIHKVLALVPMEALSPFLIERLIFERYLDIYEKSYEYVNNLDNVEPITFIKYVDILLKSIDENNKSHKNLSVLKYILSHYETIKYEL